MGTVKWPFSERGGSSPFHDVCCYDWSLPDGFCCSRIVLGIPEPRPSSISLSRHHRRVTLEADSLILLIGLHPCPNSGLICPALLRVVPGGGSLSPRGSGKGQREEGGRLFTCVLAACWSCLPPFPFPPHHGRARALTRVPLVACPCFASRATFRVSSAASVASAVLPLSHSVVRCHRFALGRVRVLLDDWRLSEVALERHNPALPLPPPAVVLCISWVCIVSYTLHIPSFVITAYAGESYRD